MSWLCRHAWARPSLLPSCGATQKATHKWIEFRSSARSVPCSRLQWSCFKGGAPGRSGVNFLQKCTRRAECLCSHRLRSHGPILAHCVHGLFMIRLSEGLKPHTEEHATAAYALVAHHKLDLIFWLDISHGLSSLQRIQLCPIWMFQTCAHLASMCLQVQPSVAERRTMLEMLGGAFGGLFSRTSKRPGRPAGERAKL